MYEINWWLSDTSKTKNYAKVLRLFNPRTGYQDFKSVLILMRKPIHSKIIKRATNRKKIFIYYLNQLLIL